MPSIRVKDKISVTKFRVKYKDVFNLVRFYKDLHEWMKEYGWTDVDDKGDHYENFYLEKVAMDGSKELWMKWRPQKVPDNSPFYRYWMDVNMHCIAMTSKEIVQDGKKFKMNKGEIDITVTSIIELDYNHQWENHGILKFFKKLFTERIFRKELHGDRKRELYRETNELHNYLKQWFKMKRHLPYEDTEFYTSRAVPSNKRE